MIYPSLAQGGRRVPIHAVGWFCGAVALALMACFTLGFLAARGGM